MTIIWLSGKALLRIQDLLDEFIASWPSVTAAFCMENIWFILALILLNSFFSSSDLYWNSIWVNFKDNVPSFKPLTPNVILIHYIWRQCFKQETWSNRFSHSFWKHDARRSKYLLLNLNWKFCIFFSVASFVVWYPNNDSKNRLRSGNNPDSSSENEMKVFNEIE